MLACGLWRVAVNSNVRRLEALERQRRQGASPEDVALVTWLLEVSRERFPALVRAVEDAGGGKAGAAAVCDLLEAVHPKVAETFWQCANSHQREFPGLDPRATTPHSGNDEEIHR